MQEASYNDKVNIENEKRLRQHAGTCRISVKSFSAALSLPPLPGQESPTATICGFSFVFWRRNILTWRMDR